MDASTPVALTRNAPSAPLPLKLEGLSYQMGEKVLIDQISLSIKAGSRHLILGPNGAGKSLLLRLMHGLLTPTRGQLFWADDHQQARQAMVFQRPVLLRRSARDNIVFALELAKVKGDLPHLANQALDRVGLSALADRPARLCSIGEQQRLALARAWAVEPELLFLDEPSASLDPSATRHIEAIINAILHGNQGDPTRKVVVRAYSTPGSWGVEIGNEGPGYDWKSAARKARTNVNLESPTGRGLALILGSGADVHFLDRGRQLLIVRRLGLDE